MEINCDDWNPDMKPFSHRKQGNEWKQRKKHFVQNYENFKLPTIQSKLPRDIVSESLIKKKKIEKLEKNH